MGTPPIAIPTYKIKISLNHWNNHLLTLLLRTSFIINFFGLFIDQKGFIHGRYGEAESDARGYAREPTKIDCGEPREYRRDEGSV